MRPVFRQRNSAHLCGDLLYLSNAKTHFGSRSDGNFQKCAVNYLGDKLSCLLVWSEAVKVQKVRQKAARAYRHTCRVRWTWALKSKLSIKLVHFQWNWCTLRDPGRSAFIFDLRLNKFWEIYHICRDQYMENLTHYTEHWSTQNLCSELFQAGITYIPK